MLILGIFIGLALSIPISKLRKCMGSNISKKSDINSGISSNPYIMEINKTLTLRTYATERLRRNEFWIQTINIFYSCFTALLAVLSLRDDTGFLTVPSALFTVAVAILVTYANAQRFGDRANDLKANCIDLKLSLNDYLDEQTKNDERHNILSEYIKKLADSENHSIIDEWRYYNGNQPHFLYHIYLICIMTFIAILFFIPILFVLLNWNNFVSLF